MKRTILSTIIAGAVLAFSVPSQAAVSQSDKLATLSTYASIASVNLRSAILQKNQLKPRYKQPKMLG